MMLLICHMKYGAKSISQHDDTAAAFAHLEQVKLDAIEPDGKSEFYGFDLYEATLLEQG